MRLGNRTFVGGGGIWYSSLGVSTQVSTSRSRKLSHHQSLGSCCVAQRAVASDHDKIGTADSVGGREVDRIMSAQSMTFSQLASVASEGVVDVDEVDLLEQGIERRDRVAQLPSGEPSKPLGLGESGARLRVDEPDAHDPIGAVPQGSGAIGPGFGDQ